VRTLVDPPPVRADAPVRLERIEALPVETIEIADLVRDFHRESLIRGVYRDHAPADRLEWPAGARGVSYYQMAGLALETLGDDRDFDLVVFVTATPDCQLTHFSGPRFNEELPGRPGIMGIGDHGVAGPFTALRLVANHLRHGLVSRALVLVMEQAMLPVVPGQLRVPSDSAVMMVVSSRSGPRIDRIAVDRAEDAPPEIDDLERSLVVQGANADFVPAHRHGDTWKTERTYACTGVWERYATGSAPGDRRVVLADADPTLPYRCVAVLEPETPMPPEEPRS
jgi:hypothetical protein